jgi:hypothetical protein
LLAARRGRFGLVLGFGIGPLAVFADEVNEAVNGLFLWDVEFDGGLADVEVDFARRTTHVAKVGIGHFSRAVDDAAHDGDFDALEVAGAGFDAGGDGLEVEEGAATGGAGHVVGLEGAAAGGLEDVVGQLEGGAGCRLAADEDGVAYAVAQEGAKDGGGGNEGGGGVGRGDGRRGRGEGVFEEDGVLGAGGTQAGGQQAEGGNRVEGAGVGNGDDFALRRQGEVDGVDFRQGEFFEDGFGFDVGARGDARGQGVVVGAGGDDGHGVGAAKGEAVLEGERRGGVALVVEEVSAVGDGEGGGVDAVVGEVRDLVHKHAADGDFVVGVFGQGDADGVAYAVLKEGANANGGFDAPVFAFSGFGDAGVDGVVPVGAGFFEFFDEEAVGGDHDLGVGGLHGEVEVVEVVFAGDAGKFEGALDHAQGGVAVAVHDAVGEGAVVGADAHGAAQLFAQEHQGGEGFFNAVKLGLVFGVGVFADGEFFFVGIVAGVDADGFDPLGGFQGGVGFEMDVGHDGDVGEAVLVEGAANVLEVGGVFAGGGGDADDLAAGAGQEQGLAQAGFGVHGVGGEHGLDDDGVVAAHADGADNDFSGGTAAVLEPVGEGGLCGSCHAGIMAQGGCGEKCAGGREKFFVECEFFRCAFGER